MEAIEFLQERKRMCLMKKPEGCMSCPANDPSAEWAYHCLASEKACIQDPERAVAIVERWARENPMRTRLKDFAEQYPYAPVDPDTGVPYFRPALLGYCEAWSTDEGCEACPHYPNPIKRCWKLPVEEKK